MVTVDYGEMIGPPLFLETAGSRCYCVGCGSDRFRHIQGSKYLFGCVGCGMVYSGDPFDPAQEKEVSE